jgi:hypothetical protein
MPRDLTSTPQVTHDRRNQNSGEENGTARHQSLIDELEMAISQKNIGSRAEILRQITDLFVVGSEHFDSEQMALLPSEKHLPALQTHRPRSPVRSHSMIQSR